MNSLVNPSNALPLYKQVSEILYNKIESQEWRENEKIPSEAMLMEEFDVSRITVRKAISELTESGLLVRSQGRGTFVASAKNIITAQGDVGFTRSCQLAGKKAENRSGSAPYQKKREEGERGHGDIGKTVCWKRVHHLHHHVQRWQRTRNHSGGQRRRTAHRGRLGTAPGGQSGIRDQNPRVSPEQKG